MFTSRSQRIVSLITVLLKVLAITSPVNKSMRLCFTGGFHASGALVTVKQLGLHMG